MLRRWVCAPAPICVEGVNFLQEIKVSYPWIPVLGLQVLCTCVNLCIECRFGSMIHRLENGFFLCWVLKQVHKMFSEFQEDQKISFQVSKSKRTKTPSFLVCDF